MRSLFSLQDVAVKFCLFIDGLDEYDGDHADVCEFLSSLASCLHVKVCVSSRPWNVFQNFYGAIEVPKMYLHDLTRNDIRAYSESRLYGHRRWSAVPQNDNDASAMIEEITKRSSGVFLWVFLATKVLREGLDNDDSLSDLWDRLKSNPPDLEDFFKKILEGVDPFYHEKMARTLLVALAAREPLGVSLYGFIELEYEDEDYALTEAIDKEDEGPNRPRLVSIQDPVPRRLNGRCKGLLEISDGRVEFLHRTLRDYLASAEMTGFLLRKLKRPFDSHLSITRACLASFKRTYFPSEPRLHSLERWNPTPLAAAISDMLQYARTAEENGEATAMLVMALLDELEIVLEKMVKSEQIRFDHGLRWSRPDFDSVQQDMSLTRAISRRCFLRCCVVGYIERKLLVCADFLGRFDMWILRVVFNDELGLGTEHINEADRSHRRQLLRIILRHRCSPDEPPLSQRMSTSISAWSRYTSGNKSWPAHKTRVNGTVNQPQMGLIFYILSVLLDHSADPNATACTTIAGDIYQDDDSSLDTCGMPIWVTYVYSALDNSRIWNGNGYTSVLQQMLTRVSDLAAMLRPRLGPGSRTGWADLIHELRNEVNSTVNHLDNDKLHLLASVMKVLRDFDRESILPWESEEDFLRENLNYVLSEKVEWVKGKDQRSVVEASPGSESLRLSGSKGRRLAASSRRSKRVKRI